MNTWKEQIQIWGWCDCCGKETVVADSGIPEVGDICEPCFEKYANHPL